MAVAMAALKVAGSASGSRAKASQQIANSDPSRRGTEAEGSSRGRPYAKP